jgi:hypothetical protein
VLYLKLFLNYVFVYLNILHIIESCHFFLSLSALNGITYKILVSLCRVVSILSIQQGSLDIFFLLQKSVSTRIAKLNKKIFVFWWRSNKSGNHSIPLLLLTTKVFSWMRFSLGGRRSLKLDETGFSVSVISIVDCFVCSFQLLSVRVYVCSFVRLFVCSFQLLSVRLYVCSFVRFNCWLFRPFFEKNLLRGSAAAKRERWRERGGEFRSSLGEKKIEAVFGAKKVNHVFFCYFLSCCLRVQSN